MPRNVRNFWMDASFDGKGTDLASGPVGKEGGLKATFYVREDGEVAEGITVEAFHYRSTGENVLRVFDNRTRTMVHELRVTR